MLSGTYLGGNVASGDSMALTDAELRATPVPVTVSNSPATQPVSGTVAINGAVAVTGPLTDAALRAAAVPVSLATAPTTPVTGTFWPATQPVSGSVSVSNLPATQPVSGTVAVTGTFWQATQPVSLASVPTTPVTGTFWQATQPVSGTVTVSNAVALDATLTGGSQVAIVKTAAKGSTVAGSPTSTAVDANTQALDVSVKGTVPVSIASMPSTPVTGAFFQATQPVSGTVVVSNFPASQAVTGTFFQATQPVSGTVASTQSGTWTVQPGNTANTTAWKVDGSAVTQPVSIAAVVSSTLANSAGKTLAMKTGSIVTTATTADQVILTYTVTSGKTFYLQYLNFQCRLTTFAATATLFGTASLESPAGTKLLTRQIVGTGAYDDSPGLQFAEPLPIAAGTVIRVVCTPAAITSFTWQCSFGGFER